MKDEMLRVQSESLTGTRLCSFSSFIPEAQGLRASVHPSSFILHPCISSRPRVHFWDHFRDAMIFLAVTWHCSVIYGTRVRGRWFFQDQETGFFFDIFVFVGELFILPLMFYVAGHFAVGSIEKHGARQFLADKARRLLIPFAFGVVFLVPINFYLNRCVFGTARTGYIRYWFGTYFTTDLGPAHLWFLYTLFFFCAVYAVVWTAHRRMSGARATAPAVPREPATRFLLLFGLLTAVGLAAVTLTVGYAPWSLFLGLKLFPYQSARFVLYICYFFIGVYGALNGWTWANASRGKVAGWTALLACASLGLMVFRARYSAHVDNSPLLALCNALLHAFATLGALGAYAMGLRLWCTRPSKSTRLFTVNSYSIYIVHQPIVVWLQYMLLGIRASAYLKFAVVFGLALPLSVLASHFILRRLPGLRNVL